MTIFKTATPSLTNSTMTKYLSILCLFCNVISVWSVTNPPIPTPDQLVFQDMEIGALISYNLATAAHTQGCGWNKPPPPSTTFTDGLPSKINTDQWCEAIASFGGKYATIVAKHLCGFTLWPSKAKSGNFTFNYGTNDINIDIVQQLSESCASVGVKLGIYYSVDVNAYLNVNNGQVQNFTDPTDSRPRITQEQYIDIVQQQLTELWTNYGPLAEIWFDGGFNVPGMKNQLLSLYEAKQPHAAVFNGCGLTKNAVLWIGSESGHAKYPVWNNNNVPSDCGGGEGEINGTSYIPKEVDLTLQKSDTWFYSENMGYKTLEELVSIYHDSVGHGGNMLLNLAPPHNSTLPSAAMALYAGLGTFTKTCYGEGATPSVTTLASTSCYKDCNSIELTSSSSSTSKITFDRILLKEEMSKGQLITEFQVLADEVAIFNGTAVGRSLIVLLPKNITASKIKIQIINSKAEPSFRLISIPNPNACVVNGGGDGNGCNLQENTVIGGFPSAVPVTSVSTVNACCKSCRKNALHCVAFTAVPVTILKGKQDESVASYDCTLLKATGGASKTVQGAVSGSPK